MTVRLVHSAEDEATRDAIREALEIAAAYFDASVQGGHDVDPLTEIQIDAVMHALRERGLTR